MHPSKAPKPATGPAKPKTATKPKGNASAKNKGGRPAFVIDFARLKALAQIQCTDVEIAAVLGCSHATFERGKAKDPRIAEFMEEGKAAGRISLRRKQFEIAMKGNPTMLIWCGKQSLGQSDKLNTHNEHEILKPMEFADLYPTICKKPNAEDDGPDDAA